jgi:hypothetical protein
MQRVKDQAKQELRGFLDDEESTSPVARRLVEEPRPVASIPAKQTINYCDDLLGQKLEVFKQIKQRFEDSKGHEGAWENQRMQETLRAQQTTEMRAK